MIDKGINAIHNQAKRGHLRLVRSLREEEGAAHEAVKQFKDVEQMHAS